VSWNGGLNPAPRELYPSDGAGETYGEQKEGAHSKGEGENNPFGKTGFVGPPQTNLIFYETHDDMISWYANHVPIVF